MRKSHENATDSEPRHILSLSAAKTARLSPWGRKREGRQCFDGTLDGPVAWRAQDASYVRSRVPLCESWVDHFHNPYIPDKSAI